MNISAKKRHGFIAKVAWVIVRFLVIIILASLIAALMAIVMIRLQGESATSIMLNHEIQDAHDLIVQHSNDFESSRVNRWVNDIPAITGSAPVLLPVIDKSKQQQLWMAWYPVINAVLLSVKLSLLRFYIAMHELWLFLILGLVGLSDGLSQRVIRRLSGGRESALIYHSAKSLVMIVLLLGVFLAIVLPVSLIMISEIMMIAFILSAGFLQLTAKQFKKYL